MARPRTTRSAPVRARRLAAALIGVGFLLPAALGAQTIRGTLLDVDTDQPIPLGLVLMYSEAGDSITATISDGVGHFAITAPEPGNFVLHAAALGYRETPAGVFELGDGASMTVEYRLPPAPLPIDALMVSVDRPVAEHRLVSNGFVRRLQRGLGRFVTPADIEESAARNTESLLDGFPSVRVGPVAEDLAGVGSLPAPHLGESVLISGPNGGWCQPTVYVDGIRAHYEPEAGFTISMIAPLGDVDAIEVYRRAAEVPVEFFPGPNGEACGVLVVWTKTGLAPGQRPTSATAEAIVPGSGEALPTVEVEGEPPVPGETIRMELAEGASNASGLASPWQGTLMTVSAGALVVDDAATGRPVSVPVGNVTLLQVSRKKGRGDALLRGAVAGSLFGLGVAGFLDTLCRFTCRGGPDQHDVLVPSVLTGLFIGGLVTARGPGSRWVRAPIPEVSRGPEPGSLGVGLRVPLRER